MTTASWVLLAVAGVAAVADWLAVWRRPPTGSRAADRSGRSENVLKPLVLVALIAMALTLDPVDGTQRSWFVAALVLSLAGDVFLLPTVDRFIPGLASFLLAHVAYVIGFAQAGGDANAGLGVLVVLAVIGARIVSAVRRTDRALVGPVVAYIAVIGAMVGFAIAHGNALGTAGALVFAASDSILALDRFDRHRRWMPTAVMVTYHCAQALLVLSVASTW